MDICIDFDGTCVSHEFPNIGKDIGAVPVLKKIVQAGHNLILFTMRSDAKSVNSDDYNIHAEAGNYLSEAVKWFEDNGIKLYGVNCNPTQKSWTESPKAYGQMYIDDAALGCPVTCSAPISLRPFVDWARVELMLKIGGIIE